MSGFARKGFGYAGAILLVFLLSVVALSAVLVSSNKAPVTYRSFATSSTLGTNNPITRKVQLIIFNPLQSNGQTLVQYYGWNDPDSLTSQIFSDLQTASSGFANFTIADRVVVNGYPVHTNGFVYNNTTYAKCVSSNYSNCDSAMLDYNWALATYSSCQKLNNGTIDEVWLWGGGGFGFWEATAAGPYNNAYTWIGPPVNNTGCGKLLPIMGYNYSRVDAEAIHSFGHRVEATVSYAYGYTNPPNYSWNSGKQSSAWEKFEVYNQDIPGRARCGNVHFPPNGTSDYDYGNTSTVLSACDSWYNYPNLNESFVPISCTAWGCNHCASSPIGQFDCQQKNYLMWWYKHLPKADGWSGTKANNWWKYALDYQGTIASIPTPTPTLTPTPTCLSQYSSCSANSQCCSGTCAPSSTGNHCL